MNRINCPFPADLLHFNTLPEDCVFYVFRLLNKNQLGIASLVCKSWNSWINEPPQTIWRWQASLRFHENKFYFHNLLDRKCIGTHTASYVYDKETMKSTLAKLTQTEVLEPEMMESIVAVVYAVWVEFQGFNLNSTFRGLSDFLSDADLAPIHGGNKLETNEVKIAAPLLLLKGLRHSNPELVNATLAALKTLFFSLLPANVDADRHFPLKEVLYFILAAYLTVEPSKENIKKIIDLFDFNLHLLQEFAYQLPAGAPKECFFDRLAVQVQTQNACISWKEIVLGKGHRIFCSYYLMDIHRELLRLSQIPAGFESHFERILILAGKAIRGLGKRSTVEPFKNPWKVEGNRRFFGGLERYLNCLGYRYVCNNTVSRTSTLRKAAVLFIIRGLESEQEVIHRMALKIFKKILTEYLECDQSLPSRNAIKEIVFELIQGYFNSGCSKNEIINNYTRLSSKLQSLMQELLERNNISDDTRKRISSLCHLQKN